MRAADEKLIINKLGAYECSIEYIKCLLLQYLTNPRHILYIHLIMKHIIQYKVRSIYHMYNVYCIYNIIINKFDQ